MTQPFVITIASGKGGVGKTTLSVQIAWELSQHRSDVLIFDADFGAPNLHLQFGIKSPKKHLYSGLVANGSLEPLETTIENSSLKAIFGISNNSAGLSLEYAQGLAQEISNRHSGLMIMDAAAGASADVTQLMGFSNFNIIVLDPDPKSVENAYSLVKTYVLMILKRFFMPIPEAVQYIEGNARKGITLPQLIQKLEKFDKGTAEKAEAYFKKNRFGLILNNARFKDDVNLGEKFSAVTKKYLNIESIFLGYVVDDFHIKQSAMKLNPIYNLDPELPSRKCLRSISENIFKIVPPYINE